MATSGQADEAGRDTWGAVRYDGKIYGTGLALNANVMFQYITNIVMYVFLPS